jgi:hypothetical protein
MQLIHYAGYVVFGLGLAVGVAAWAVAFFNFIVAQQEDRTHRPLRWLGGIGVMGGRNLSERGLAAKRSYWLAAAVFIVSLAIAAIGLLMVDPGGLRAFFRPAASATLP